jgi:ribosome biogenesis GTPase
MNQSVEAVVLVSHGSHGVVELADGVHRDCHFRRRVGRPCCGDHVIISSRDGESWVVSEILARRNVFMRADRQGEGNVIAANLDRVLVVVAPRPLPSRDLLDRYLVAVHSLGMEPLIVLNKVDLLGDSRGGGDRASREKENAPGWETLRRLPQYEALGYPVLRTSAKGAPGIEALRGEVASGVSILVGQSGVGKSSLVRALLPDLDIQTGELSRATGKGTHTTTTTMLYRLPGAGRLMDSPGVWEYGLWRLDPAELGAGFTEFRDYLGQCRFNDCRHAGEPGCAVRAAVDRGDIHAWRYRAYRRLLEQNPPPPSC